MNRQVLVRILILGTFLLTACYASAGAGVSSSHVVYHTPPYADAVWSSGYWNWSGNQWIWTDGYWISPRPGYIYVQPYWARRGNGWAFSRGYWRSARTPHPRYAPVYRYPTYRDRARWYRGSGYSRPPAYRAVPARSSRGVQRNHPSPRIYAPHRAHAPSPRLQGGFQGRSRAVWRGRPARR